MGPCVNTDKGKHCVYCIEVIVKQTNRGGVYDPQIVKQLNWYKLYLLGNFHRFYTDRFLSLYANRRRELILSPTLPIHFCVSLFLLCPGFYCICILV